MISQMTVRETQIQNEEVSLEGDPKTDAIEKRDTSSRKVSVKKKARCAW